MDWIRGRGRSRWSRVVAVALMFAMPGCSDDDSADIAGVFNVFPGNAPASIVDENFVASDGLAFTVGQERQLNVIIENVPAGQLPPMVWSSLNPGVVVIDPSTGLARGVALGQTTITVRLASDPRTLDSVSAECILDEVQEPGETGIITIGGGNVRFEHAVGSSPCPQEAGSFTVRNVSRLPATVQASPRHRAIEVRPVAFTLEPGATETVTVYFNCAVRSSFQTTINVNARNAAGEDSRPVRVDATVQ